MTMTGTASAGTCVLRAGALALTLLVACPAAAGEGAAPDAAGLTLQPAELTPAATKAMMLSVARAGKRIVAAGDRGIVLLSDDDGATFRQARSVPVRSTLTAVCFAGEKTGWAVGHWGVVLRTDDGGESWKVQRADTSVDQPLFSVYFKDAEHGWAVGLWSLMITTADGGKTWAPVRLPAPPGGGKADRNLLKIFADRRGALFVAAEQGVVLRSHDGEKWSYVSTGYRGSLWTGMALSDGTLLVGGLRGTIYRSADGGSTWSESRTDLKSSITDLGEAEGKVFAVGLDGASYESDDRGATFRSSQRDDRLPFTALAVAGSGRLVKFSKQGLVEDASAATK
jgi:photosystem II stability/assembly factor-like uncharacterized protein